jgi:hypothetical protein
VTDARGRVRPDAFVAGERHQLAVRIAAARSTGTVVADAVVRPPAPGRGVELTVIARVRGRRRGAGASHRSACPRIATAVDPAVRGRRARRVDRVAVEIVVLHEGRTVQTAVLSGAIVAADVEPAPEGLTLTVDAETPPGDLTARRRLRRRSS